MKPLRFLRPTRSAILISALLFFAGCESGEKKDLNAAFDKLALGQTQEALFYFERVLKRAPESEEGLKAAREAARISFFETKNFEKTVEFNKFIVVQSPHAADRLEAQKQIAEVLFSNLNDYPKAVLEINRLLTMVEDVKERAALKVKLARAYYYQNNFPQAENEVNEFLRTAQDEQIRFEMMMLKGNIALAQKDLLKAIEIYKEVARQFPKRAVQENVSLTLAICYEENRDYKNAILTLETLKKTHPVPEYIDVRIKRLMERQKNAPGAKGPRK